MQSGARATWLVAMGGVCIGEQGFGYGGANDVAVSKRIPSLLMYGTLAADVKTSSGLLFDGFITKRVTPKISFRRAGAGRGR